MEYYRIPGSDNVSINELRRIVAADPSVVKKIRNDIYELTLLGKRVQRHSHWLLCIALIGYIDEFDRDHLVVQFSPFSRSKRFPYIVTYNQPKYDDDAHEFRCVPGVPFIATDQYGNVIDTSTGATLKQIIDKSGYAHVSDGLRLHSVHRLVAKAWIEGNSPSLNVVNHIKGKEKSNNCISNLEWTTYKGNSDHALRTGLLPFAHKGRIRDIYTGEVTEFPSLESMNAFLGLHQKEIRHFLKRRRNLIYCDRYEVRIDGDKRPWVYENGQAVNIEPSRYIYHIKENGVPYIVNGIRQLIKRFKCWNMGGTSNKRALEFIAKNRPDVEISVIDQYDTGPYEVRDIQTNQIDVYQHIYDIVRNKQMCKTTVLDALKDPGRKVIYDRYVVRVKSDEPWPTDIKMAQYRPMPIRVIDKTSGHAVEYASLKEAARKTGIERAVLKRMLRRSKYSDTVTVEKIDANPSSLSSNR